jgi:enoyl reductase-like protein
MKKEGLPIEGLCVAAGIPSTEKAKEVIDGLRGAGIKHVAFKPGSLLSVLRIFLIQSCSVFG